MRVLLDRHVVLLERDGLRLDVLRTRVPLLPQREEIVGQLGIDDCTSCATSSSLFFAVSSRSCVRRVPPRRDATPDSERSPPRPPRSTDSS
jgi:hypothetical protein